VSLFHEAFIFQADGSELAEWGVRENDLVRTDFVPVPDADAAARAAAELVTGGLDLLELYGFGPVAAAKALDVTRGEVPVGLVGVEDRQVVRSRAVISPSPGADPAVDRYVHEGRGGRMTVVSVPGPQAVPATAVELVEEGVERIDMCGGLGPVPAAAAIEAVGERVCIGAVMFGFESLPGVAAYRARFEQAMTS
jgi:hypothetical protein